MVTPASLMENISSRVRSVSSNSEMNEVALGHIPDLDEINKASLSEEDSEESAAGLEGPANSLDSEDKTPSRAEDTELIKSMMDVSQFEMKLTGIGKRKREQTRPPVQVWLPLTFPEIPKKVSFIPIPWLKFQFCSCK